MQVRLLPQSQCNIAKIEKKSAMKNLSCIENWHQSATPPSNGLERILARPDNSVTRGHVTRAQIRCRRVASCVQAPGQTLQTAKVHGLRPHDNGVALINRLKTKGGLHG